MMNLLRWGWLALAALPAMVGAMDFAYRPAGPPSGDTKTRLVMSGPIVAGDAERFRAFVVAHPPARDMGAILLDSPGGSIAEAIRLAEIMKEMLASVIVFPPAKCVSACFFLYVGAASRDAVTGAGGGIAIHRPYVAPAKQREIGAAESAATANAGYAVARRWLQEQLVPQELVDKMFSYPSHAAYWLTSEDLERLGTEAPWFEEWVLARCPGIVQADRRLNTMQREDPKFAQALRAYQKELQCAEDLREIEMKKVFARYRLQSKASEERR